jgi:hypothetical protein
MTSIDGVGNSNAIQNNQDQSGGADSESSGRTFGSVMSGVADGILSGVARAAPLFPGGQLVGMAAEGLMELKGSAPDGLPGGGGDEQMDDMFAMQRESQAFNMQYLQLQTELQNDNRRFSTLTNLMKVRHDTAKAAINNMHA